MLNQFDLNIYSEETFAVSEQEHDEVMLLIAEESNGWQSYGEWSAEIDRQPSIENFVIVNGKVQHKPEPRSLGRIGGYEL
jgi:hypothetical protein